MQALVAAWLRLRPCFLAAYFSPSLQFACIVALTRRLLALAGEVVHLLAALAGVQLATSTASSHDPHAAPNLPHADRSGRPSGIA